MLERISRIIWLYPVSKDDTNKISLETKTLLLNETIQNSIIIIKCLFNASHGGVEY